MACLLSPTAEDALNCQLTLHEALSKFTLLIETRPGTLTLHGAVTELANQLAQLATEY